MFKGQHGNTRLRGHFADILTIATNEQGNYLVSGGADKILRVWDTRIMKQVYYFDQHNDYITVL